MSMDRPDRTPKAALEAEAKELRIQIVEAIHKAGSGHPGGSLSALDLVLTLFSGEMRYRPSEPHWPERDRFVLSKGHGVPALYAVMGARGFFPLEKLQTLRELGSPIQGHPANALLPGIEASTGSLGQGLSMAQGMALAAKVKGEQDNKSEAAWQVYCVCGDGELQEGQVWEAAMSAPHLGITNLTVFVDWNAAQIDGLVEDVMSLDPLKDKWEAFGWHVQTIDGHDIDAIRQACDTARSVSDKPCVVLAHTIKGKGYSLFEKDIVGWHGQAPSQDDMAQIRAEHEGGAA
jgi:transketolase